MLPLVVLAEDIGPKWLYWPWVQDHTDEIRQRLIEHIELTVLAVLFGLAIALPLALLSVRYRRLYGPVIAITGVLYTIPSLALFALLLPLTGLSRTTALIPLTAYTLLILVRNTVTGLDGVPPDVKDAAVGMGYSRNRQLLRVELPLALPGDHRRHPHRHRHDHRAGRHHRAHRPGRTGLADVRRLPARLPHAAHRRHRAVARARGRRRPAPRARAATRDAVGACGSPPVAEGGCVMGFFGDVFDFLTNHDQWHGDESIPRLLGQHVQLTVVSVLVAALVALPIGILLGHVRTGGAIAVNIANIGRALPAFALLILAVQWVGIGDPTGVLTPVQSVPAFIAMFALAVPPMLANAYVGMASVDDEIREAARGMGMNGRQMIWRVELPNAVPVDHGRRAHRDGRGGRDRDARRVRRLRRLRPLHRRRLRGVRQRQGLRRGPPRRAARHRARARPRAGRSARSRRPASVRRAASGCGTWPPTVSWPEAHPPSEPRRQET